MGITYQALQLFFKEPVRIVLDGVDYVGRARQDSLSAWEVHAVNLLGQVKFFRFPKDMEQLNVRPESGGLLVDAYDLLDVELYFYTPRYDV